MEMTSVTRREVVTMSDPIEVPRCSEGHECTQCRREANERAMGEASMGLAALLKERDAAMAVPRRQLTRSQVRRGQSRFGVYDSDGLAVFDDDGKRIRPLPDPPTAMVTGSDGKRYKVRPAGCPPIEGEPVQPPWSSTARGYLVWRTDDKGLQHLVPAPGPEAS
jgi:hypothetical protein